MNSQKLKKNCKDKFVNDSPDVLVLTPNILQKLGINLKNIQSNTDGSINSPSTENLNKLKEPTYSSIIEHPDTKPYKNDSSSETSILKTANLMKESVLLSPTFSTNEIQAEVQINNFDNVETINEKQSTSKEFYENVRDEMCFTSINQIIANTVTTNLKTKILSKHNDLLNSKQDEICTPQINGSLINLLSTPISENNTNVINPRLEEIGFVTEMKDLNEFGSSGKIILSPHDKKLPVNNLKISEQTTSLSQDIEHMKFSKRDQNINTSKEVCIQNGIRNMNKKLLSPSEKSNIDKELDIIDTKTKSFQEIENNISKQFGKGNNNSNQIFTNGSQIFINDKLKLIQVHEKHDLIISNEENQRNLNNTHDTDLLDTNNRTEANATCIKTSIVCNHFPVSTNTLSNIEGPMDSIKNMNSFIHPDDCIDKNINSEENLITSKLCIQGVEKPGGESVTLIKNKITKPLKTYSKIIKTNSTVKTKDLTPEPKVKTYSRTKKTKPFNTYTNIVDHLDIDYKINDAKQDILNFQSFCICKDFGNFDYYESGDRYEHIHFLNGNNAYCSLDVLLSIYNDERNIEEVNYEMKSKEDLEEIDLLEDLNLNNNICYCYIETKSENVDIDGDVVYTENNKRVEKKEPKNEIESTTGDNKLKGTSENKNTPKKRKRSSMSDSDKPLAKIATATVVCGACDREVRKIDWENHISKMHCFIAWKKDESIDFDDKRLVEKLTKRLSDTGELMCTFCNYEQSEVKKFIRHAKKCVNKIRSHKSRKRSSLAIDTIKTNEEAESHFVCGVCQSEVEENLWIEHICKEHNYLAWKQDEQPLDCTDEDEVLSFLDTKRKTIGRLECSKCGLPRKHVKAYVNHIKQCANIELVSTKSKVYQENEHKSDIPRKSKILVPSVSKCGVCHIEIEDDKWIEHICTEHGYLAWKEGEKAVNIDDATKVYDHLYNLTKELDGLLCPKCGLRRKYVKAYLTHIKKCTGDPNSQNTTIDDTFDPVADSPDDEESVKCGVCQKELEGKQWLYHIQSEHSYMAWKEGEPALDVNNQADVLAHLNEMNKKYNGLICIKCGITRKYVKVFLSHIETCDSTFMLNSSIKEEGVKRKDAYECGMCSELVNPKDWKSHAMKMHYNVTWIVGDYPIDPKNPNAVDNCLKEYRKYYRKLECRLCGLIRVSTLGFYAHVIQCGKSEEEIEKFRNHCDVCNNKYLCIYEKQHYQSHKEQEVARELKKSLVAKTENDNCENDVDVTEGRLAAKRARNFIGKYQTFDYICSSCGFGADDERELEDHVCSKNKYKDFSDSEDSLQFDNMSSGDESEDKMDSNSETEMANHRLKKPVDSRSLATRIKRIPFDIKNPKAYLMRSAEEFREANFTSDILYPQWQKCNCEMVPDSEVAKYMPPLDNSCKVMISKNNWNNLDRFEGSKESGAFLLFAGTSIQCLSWAPHDEQRDDGHFLAVSGHNATDSPRLDVTDIDMRPNMLQIWDFGDFSSKPKFVLGIAHEYGIIWSMDWCASGTRGQLSENSNSFKRLGLLAAACSNGLAYIFSIPYPETITDNEKIIYKLTPVAELRISRGERDKFQSTSISWSPQRGHSVILVGYADGLTALFDLECDSPLLTVTENELKIFYPYHEERSHTASVTGVSALGGAAGSASATGALSARRGAARLRSSLPASGLACSPLWPSALLVENDGIVNQSVNELDWWGYGQRLGNVHSCSSCITCGTLAAYAPPLLRQMTTHPAYPSLNKQPVAYFNMTPLAKKRTKQKTDELALKLEPRTYEDAVKVYGIEFKYAKDLDKAYLQQISNKPKEHCHERFPLSDIPSMAFNPAVAHHRKLAVATHSGIVFVITV